MTFNNYEVIINEGRSPLKMKRTPTCLLCNEPIIKYTTHKCKQKTNKPKYISKSFLTLLWEEFFPKKTVY